MGLWNIEIVELILVLLFSVCSELVQYIEHSSPNPHSHGELIQQVKASHLSPFSGCSDSSTVQIRTHV